MVINLEQNKIHFDLRFILIYNIIIYPWITFIGNINEQAINTQIK